MFKIIPELLCSAGIAILVGGLLAFYYGLHMKGSEIMFGYWTRSGNVCLFGGTLAVIGSAVAIFGVLWIRVRKSPG